MPYTAPRNKIKTILKHINTYIEKVFENVDVRFWHHAILTLMRMRGLKMCEYLKYKYLL